ncbi:uncharacterized protein HMPREF1541_00589 [Cyphellophora europaea CBS 101466]|uniref:Regulator of volume decrease after cellular swelling-domain-containing protein n=1 Tax=Cyphellophora europaea (strain CBS 101466) TaxID=1220924 RepID=W2SCS5_CYPE1|nr:uncharacterized protein HMPREF1541_00589 [Cyphellophora europaea CBS 101466]ETN46405.1 hypothetical protein HMPREF1541_00589 [Cyphellophora europaea CBS 101466]
MEVIREAPKASTFVPLAEHQSATPASFYTGPPVLHYHSDRSKVIVLERDASGAALLEPLLQHASSAPGANTNGGAETNGHGETSDIEQKVLEDVDVWVTSDKLFLFSNVASTGLSIPYPSISLHAIQTLPSAASGEAPTPSQGVYMQLMASNNDTLMQDPDDIEPESISLTIVPTASAPPQGMGSAAGATTAASGDEIENEEEPEQTPAQALFNALSNCSNLHPDPVEDEEEDGAQGSRLIQSGLAIPLGGEGSGLPPPMPGSGGWITAENMHEFVDEDGNWIEDAGEEAAGEAPLGPGAGTVRSRDDGEDGGGGDNTAADGEDAKWQRTG